MYKIVILYFNKTKFYILLYFRDEEEEEDNDEDEEDEEERDSGHSSEEDSVEVKFSSNRTVINETEPLEQFVSIGSSSSCEDNVIRIKHTQLEPKPTSYCTESPYQTPACIYKEYVTIKNKHESKKKVEFNVTDKIEELPVRENRGYVDNVIHQNVVSAELLFKKNNNKQNASFAITPKN